MKILETLQKVFAKGPAKEVKPKKEKKQDQPVHHHNHGSSTT